MMNPYRSARLLTKSIFLPTSDAEAEAEGEKPQHKVWLRAQNHVKRSSLRTA